MRRCFASAVAACVDLTQGWAVREGDGQRVIAADPEVALRYGESLGLSRESPMIERIAAWRNESRGIERPFCSQLASASTIISGTDAATRGAVLPL